MSVDREQARAELARVESVLKGESVPAKIFEKVCNAGVPFVGTVAATIAKLIGPPPEIKVYAEELREVVNGTRDTMPEKPVIRSWQR